MALAAEAAMRELAAVLKKADAMPPLTRRSRCWASLPAWTSTTSTRAGG